MAKGRRPSSTESKIARGNPGKRAITPVKEIAGKDKVSKPVGMSAAAAVLWDKEVPVMVDAGLLDGCDAFILGQFFEAWAIANACIKELENDSDGIVIHNYNNTSGERKLSPHPATKILSQAQSTMRQIGVEYGLTPAARAKLSSSNPGEAKISFDLDKPFSLKAVK